jgi:preprotein translocase subunit YajC
MRPARTQQRQVAQLQQDLAVGDDVIISAGVFGTIVALEGDTVKLEIAPGVVITAARQVVVRRAPEPDAQRDGVDQAEAAPDSTTEDD